MRSKTHCYEYYLALCLNVKLLAWPIFFIITPYLLKAESNPGKDNGFDKRRMLTYVWNTSSLQCVYPQVPIWSGSLCASVSLVTVMNVRVCPVLMSCLMVREMKPGPLVLCAILWPGWSTLSRMKDDFGLSSFVTPRSVEKSVLLLWLLEKHDRTSVRLR